MVVKQFETNIFLVFLRKLAMVPTDLRVIVSASIFLAQLQREHIWQLKHLWQFANKARLFVVIPIIPRHISLKIFIIP